MSKRKWAVLILSVLLLAGYWKFFYKTWSERSVVKSADCIIALDVKRITNTVLWNIITTPGQWKKISFSSSGKLSWKDMVKIPDYVFIFHVAGQPANAWYSLLEIKDEKDFEKGLQLYHFEKKDSANNQVEYYSEELGIDFIRMNDRILVGNLAVSGKNYIGQVADELFIKKQFISRDELKKNIEAKSHLSILFVKNSFMHEDAVLKANFDKNKISIDMSIAPSFAYTEHDFTYPISSCCVAGFTQPSAAFYSLLQDSVRAKLSKAVNFNIDSVFLQNNSHYDLDFEGMKSRNDTAVSYTYDDNFNPIEKKVVSQVNEPAFSFTINGNNVTDIYDYWNRNDKLEPTSAGELFTPMPFVRSYCSRPGSKQLSIISDNYISTDAVSSIRAVFFLNIAFTGIDPGTKKYFPSWLLKLLENLETFRLSVQQKDGQLNIHSVFRGKLNDLPIINW